MFENCYQSILFWVGLPLSEYVPSERSSEGTVRLKTAALCGYSSDDPLLMAYVLSRSGLSPETQQWTTCTHVSLSRMYEYLCSAINHVMMFGLRWEPGEHGVLVSGLLDESTFRQREWWRQRLWGQLDMAVGDSWEGSLEVQWRENKEGAELRGCIGKTVSPPVVYWFSEKAYCSFAELKFQEVIRSWFLVKGEEQTRAWKIRIRPSETWRFHMETRSSGVNGLPKSSQTAERSNVSEP